ncbi:hypothetical protein [Lewinella sp. JB7]|uniref:hypothetical protein n=1 Tax=Lewinella sp. JB7 TaxID=2962887 RepID=UPI0020C985EA|nr:hypothetical protein [Lewinella sp. JB7]MCP9237188.1 hypothetical protein [Lewinella sp. JB7]
MTYPLITVRTSRKIVRRRDRNTRSRKQRRQGNELSVSGVLKAYPGSSVEEISRRSGLSPCVITKTLFELQRKGLVFCVATQGFYFEAQPCCTFLHSHHYLKTSRGYSLEEFCNLFGATPAAHVATIPE